MRNVKNKMMIAASSIGRKAVKRGAEAVSNVIDNVIDGKDVKQALEDEKTKMRIDLQRKKQKLMEKVEHAGGVKSGIKRGGRQKANKAVIKALFD